MQELEKILEEIEEEEKKMEFTKDMLKSGEHVVEYRNMSGALTAGSLLIGALKRSM